MQIPKCDNITRIKINISVGNTNVDNLRSRTALYNILSSGNFIILFANKFVCLFKSKLHIKSSLKSFCVPVCGNDDVGEVTML